MRREKSEKVIGSLVSHRDGYGFVIPEKGEGADVFIGAGKRLDAMHGDKVLVKVERVKPGGRREGRVLQIVERVCTQVVGRFEVTEGRGIVIPRNPRLLSRLIVPSSETHHARKGDLVVAEILTYPAAGQPATVKITKILGRIEDPSVDTREAMAEYRLPLLFPTDVLREAAGFPSEVTDDAYGAGRKDLRHLPAVTVDPEKAQDFDDAISVKPLPDGLVRLWVHIADVGHYVAGGTAMDQEAFRRGTSVYFPDMVIPMLPEALSNHLCSLKPGVDRLTLTVEMLFDKEGHQQSYDIYEGVIRSRARMTYRDLTAILVEKDRELCHRHRPLLEDFRAMEGLCRSLYARRMEQGGIDFDLPEPDILLDLQGQTTDILKEERTIAHRMIEEFMLEANRTVAQHVTHRSVPFIHRIHERPDPDVITEFRQSIAGLGLKLAGGHPPSPRAFSLLLKEVKGKPFEKLVNHLMLRSMKQARYSHENKGHFGLAFRHYTHFTSPIRRYPDLIVHRILKELLKPHPPSEKAWGRLGERLPEIARQSSERERIATEAERRVVDAKKIRFMTGKLGEEYEAFITGVTRYGVFVELKDIFVEGLVPLSSLMDDRYLYREKHHALIGERTRRVLRLGDKVRVGVDRVDLEARQITFSLLC